RAPRARLRRRQHPRAGADRARPHHRAAGGEAVARREHVAATLAQRRARRIQAAQRREIERLLGDEAFARAAGSDPAYARAGEWLRPPGRTLELGCGPGRFVALLATLGHTVVGVDVHEFPDWELLRPLSGVTLQSGVKAEELPFDDASFDHVSCIGALL